MEEGRKQKDKGGLTSEDPLQKPGLFMTVLELLP